MIFRCPKQTSDAQKSGDLAKWLDLATRDLVPSAQARIRAEIEAHFAEAVQSQLTNGSFQSTAQTAALTDLGDAKAASRRFRREYLTTKNARRVSKLITSSQISASLFSLSCSFFVTILSVFSSPAFDFKNAPIRFLIGGSLLLYLLLVFSCMTAYRLSKKAPTILARCRILLFASVNALIMGVLFLLESFTMPLTGNSPLDHFMKPFFRVIMEGLCVLAIYGSYRLFRLRKKLLMAREDDLPPPAPSTA